MRVLVVDDDRELVALLQKTLSRVGHVVLTAHDLATARHRIEAGADVLVLDLGLPDGSGLDLCHELRSAGDDTPILLLTARSAVSERVRGLEAGADDYLPKPFAVAELRARVQAVGRRRARSTVTVITIGPVRVDLSRRRAYRDDTEVELTPREWGVLEALAVRRGRAVERWTILEDAWGDVTEAAEASLEVLIARIRRKLGREVIRTVRGEGYAIG